MRSDREWKFIEAFTNRTDPRHEPACLLGAVGEAHDEFCDRVQRHFAAGRQPAARILRIEWESGPFPDTQAEFGFVWRRDSAARSTDRPRSRGKRLP